ncbi:MAG TPA: glutaminyl-peptide cyclotransferase [Draconibacterium sp.]|nr:glutaminyl-peptide cyclotransferase [Draconibacterium sp.]
MKPVKFTLILVLSLFITFFSCSNSSDRSRKPVSSIAVQPSKNNYVFGENVSVNVKTKVRDGEIEAIKLYFNNQLIQESTELDFTVNNVKLNKLGSGNFTVEAIKTDGLKNSRSLVINTISDNIPEKLTFQIVNTFPHSKEHYTQGLEFYNDVLYEGTGEYGTSGIFKKRLETGNIEQSKMMDEKYFGEGITILNDKIYQLTYKTQKGFVYQLSDFALIDTFQFKSAEGWGLTNDGTNLIMSDGTHVLTWLNPNDYSIVKTLQVANNKGIVNNLNELEYINGIIYANVYTTDLIVQIDPETGKVLAEINLAGIINMYKNSTDKIDFLNGIAYQKKNNKLIVTGKYWPKIFEIKLIPSK